MARYEITERGWVTNSITGIGVYQRQLGKTHNLIDTQTKTARMFVCRGTEAECEKALLNLIAAQPEESKDEQQ